MSEAPEDRGPSSLRIVKYDPSNPIHEGLVSRQRPNEGTPVNAHIDARTDHIVMPVAKGMETEPKLSGRYMTNEESAGYVVPVKDRIKLPKPKPVIKTDAPSMKTAKNAGSIYNKPRVDKEANKEAAAARQAKIAAALKAKREGKA
jgi:hypothetical protein